MSRSRSDDPLREVLIRSQRAGAIGPVSIDEVIAHSRLFVHALSDVRGRVIDIGSGGGIPGLVIAWDRPDLELVLVDRRAKRTDLLRRACLTLGLGSGVSVVNGDVSRVAGDADAVVARLFGSPAVTAAAASALVRSSGVVVVSEAPEGDRWDATAFGGWAREAVSWDDAAGSVTRFQAP